MKEGDQAGLTRKITEQDILAFAKITEDMNPLHLDKKFAEQTRFGKPVAHGQLTASLVAKVLGMELPGPGTVYLEERIRFTAPVFAGNEIEAVLIVTEVDGKFATLRIGVTNQWGFTVLDGTAKVYTGYVRE